MFEEIKNHNELVKAQIFSGFANTEDLVEKAHEVGEIKVGSDGIKRVWTQLPNGKYDWRRVKKEKRISDVNDVPEKDFKRCVEFLKKKDPDSKDAFRYLDEEEMSDKELEMFRVVAEHFRYGGQLNDSTRKRVSKWANLALEEQANRSKSRKAESFSISDLKKTIKSASKISISVDSSSSSSMTKAMETMFKHFGLKDVVRVNWENTGYAGKYTFSVNGKVVQGYNVYARDRKMGCANFYSCVNDCIAHAIIKNNRLDGKKKEEVEGMFNMYSSEQPKWNIKEA